MDLPVRGHSWHSLSEHRPGHSSGPRLPLALLIQTLNTTTNGAQIRAAAAEGLGYVGGAEAREVLIAALTTQSNGSDIRSAAAKALGMACSR